MHWLHKTIYLMMKVAVGDLDDLFEAAEVIV